MIHIHGYGRGGGCAAVSQGEAEPFISPVLGVPKGSYALFVCQVDQLFVPVHQLESCRYMAVLHGQHQQGIAVFIYIVGFGAFVQKNFGQGPGKFGAVGGGHQAG